VWRGWKGGDGMTVSLPAYELIPLLGEEPEDVADLKRQS
jgi:hypothetical protein